MMNALVQFIRNALCCVKDLKLYEDTFLYKEEHTNEWITKYSNVELIEPLNKTTPLEVLISITQLYACLSLTYSGLSLLWVSLGKMRRTVRLLDLRMPSSSDDTDDKVKNSNKKKKFSHADRIVNESLLKEAKAAMKGSFIGFLVAPIGIAFFWLFANSWHVTETPWIGGLVALIDALSVMEVCLFPLLVYMILDGLEIFKQYTQIRSLVKSVDNDDLKSPKPISVSLYENMTGWQPFWEAGLSPLARTPTASEEIKEIEGEVKSIQAMLDQWFPVASSNDDEDDDDGDDTANTRRTTRSQSKAKAVDDKNEKAEKIRLQALKQASANLKHKIPELYIKGYREFIYFVLNFVAFYGYLMGIVAFYYPDDDHQPSFVTLMKFGYGNAVADWTGNFAGDLMWTIEPIFILGSPMVMSFNKPSIEDDGDDKKRSSTKAKEE